MNGTITHGKEYLFPDKRMEPTTYYGPASGVGLALLVAAHRGTVRAGVIGLGAGTLAAYGQPGDHYTFYDINSLVIELARTHFYFLNGSRAQVEIVPGDARLSLERQPAQNFDVLAVDAFSGDAIPIHLLTREAFALYFRHLKPGGVLAVHVSNRYLDLKPVVERVAQSLGKLAFSVDSGEDDEKDIFKARWVLVSARPDFYEEPEIRAAIKPIPLPAGFPLWTDDYSSLWRILK
jgi:spermidine synthase